MLYVICHDMTHVLYVICHNMTHVLYVICHNMAHILYVICHNKTHMFSLWHILLTLWLLSLQRQESLTQWEIPHSWVNKSSSPVGGFPFEQSNDKERGDVCYLYHPLGPGGHEYGCHQAQARRVQKDEKVWQSLLWSSSVTPLLCGGNLNPRI